MTYEIVKRHADDYVAWINTDYDNMIDILVFLATQTLADGESITIVREVPANSHPNRYLAHDRATGKPSWQEDFA